MRYYLIKYVTQKVNYLGRCLEITNKLRIPDESNIPRDLDYCSPTVQDRLISEELTALTKRVTNEEGRKIKLIIFDGQAGRLSYG